HLLPCRESGRRLRRFPDQGGFRPQAAGRGRRRQARRGPRERELAAESPERSFAAWSWIAARELPRGGGPASGRVPPLSGPETPWGGVRNRRQRRPRDTP